MGINVFTDLSANDEEDDASEDIDWSDTIGLPEIVGLISILMSRVYSFVLQGQGLKI